MSYDYFNFNNNNRSILAFLWMTTSAFAQKILFYTNFFVLLNFSIQCKDSGWSLISWCCRDEVWHKDLIYKLIRLKFHSRFIHLMYSSLCDRNFRIRINSILSANLHILVGIIQGKVLGLILFNIFLTDSLHDSYRALYADDIRIYSSAHHSCSL